MVVLSAKTAEDLVLQIKAVPYEFSINTMYGLNGRHYAYIVVDRPVRVVKKKAAKKTKSLESLQDELNKEN